MSGPPTQGSFVWNAIARVTTRRSYGVLLAASLIAVVSLDYALRLRPVATIDALLDGDEPAVRAFAALSDRFAATEELLLLASLPDEVPEVNIDADADAGADRLLAFAERVSGSIKGAASLAAYCSAVHYKPPKAMRSFVEEVVIPHAMLYGVPAIIDSLARRLEPDAMREQLRRTCERLSVPGASGALARMALRDPLALREVLIDALPGGRMAGALEDGFFSPDRRHLLIRLRGIKPASDLPFASGFTEAARRMADDANLDNLELAFAGSYAIADASQRAIRWDMIVSIVVSVLLLQLLYLAAYRNLWTLPAALIPVALGILFAFGVFGALRMNLTPITAVIGAILAGLGIDYCIHFLSHYQQERTAGLDHGEATGRTVRALGPALLAACGTTVVGFLALSQSQVRALREFGFLGATGLAGALICSLFLLPAILTTAVRWNRRLSAVDSYAGTASGWLVRHAVTHCRRYATSAAVVCVLCAVCLVLAGQSGSVFEDDLSMMHPRPNAPLETQHRLAELFQASPDSLFVYLSAGDPQSLVALAHEVKARLIAASARDPLVGPTFGLATLLPDPDALASRGAQLDRLDVDEILLNFRAAASEAGFIETAFEGFEAFLRKLLSPDQAPDMQVLQRYPEVADMVLPTGVEGPLEALTTITTTRPLADRASRDRVIEVVRGALGDLPGATLTGLSVIGHDTERTIRSDLARLSAIALVVVVTLLIGFFRSVRDALLALVPAAIGMLVLMAGACLLGLRLNTVNVIALPLLVGIGVDDGIFLVSVARRVSAQHARIEDLTVGLTTGCRAIMMTSLTTILTFGSLAFTSTPAISSLGYLMALGVAASLAGAMWMLVPVLVMRHSRRLRAMVVDASR